MSHRKDAKTQGNLFMKSSLRLGVSAVDHGRGVKIFKSTAFPIA
jgi:hypothetical protein